MKIVNVCWDDYANFSYSNCQALRSIGIDCQSYKIKHHAFFYDNQSDIITFQHLEEKIKEADIVQLMHSYKDGLDLCKKYNKRVVVYHTGSAYRQKPDEHNELFNPYVEVSFTDQLEFIGMGMKNECYIATAVNTEKIIRDDRRTPVPFTIAHYPSNPEVKGSKTINRLITLLMQGYSKRFGYKYSDTIVRNSQQLQRISDCDIYIELFAPIQMGNPYGCYGVTAFEAAALGKVVVTQQPYGVYERFYGTQNPFVTVNDEQEFMDKVELLLLMNAKGLKELQDETYLWLKTYHSLQATGNYIAKKLNL